MIYVPLQTAKLDRTVLTVEISVFTGLAVMKFLRAEIEHFTFFGFDSPDAWATANRS